MIEQIAEYLEWIGKDKSSKTLELYSSSVDKLMKFFDIKDFSDIQKLTAKEMRQFQYHLKSSMKESSVNSYIRPLRAMFNWLISQEYLEKSPLEKVKDFKVPKTVRDFLTEEEQRKVMGACKNDKDRLIVAILLTTGIRRDELCSLDLKDYNGTHILVNGKGRKQRSLRLQDDVIELLNKYIEKRNKKYKDIDPLFVNRLGTRYGGDGIYKKIKSLLVDAGLSEDRVEAIHTHSLRHSFVANMFEAGADIYICSNALGHASIDITSSVYGHLHNATVDRIMQNQKSVLG